MTTGRSVTFYRYQAVALKDLYGVDFDAITDDQAAELDRRIFRNYLTKDWLFEVVTQKANIESMFNDPYWACFDFRTDYPFGVLVLNVTTLTYGFHPSEFKNKNDDPYAFAKATVSRQLISRVPRGARSAVRHCEGERSRVPENDPGLRAGIGLLQRRPSARQHFGRQRAEFTPPKLRSSRTS